MKYRTRTGKPLSDNAVIGDISDSAKGILSGSPSAAGGLVFSIISYFIGISAFITKSFLRTRIGGRSFGILTLLLVYFVILIISLSPAAYNENVKFFKDETEAELSPTLGEKAVAAFVAPFSVPYYIYKYESSNKANTDSTKQTIVPVFSVNLPFSLLVMVGIVILLGFMHLSDIYTRKVRKEVVHSNYSGDSFFFSWLVDRQVGSIKFTPIMIWMIVEPLAVLLSSFIIYRQFGNFEFSFVLAVSGICLFLEEYRLFAENKRFVFDLLDGHLDAAYAGQVQDEYDLTNKNPAKSYKVSIGGTNRRLKEPSGSSSKFRAKLL